MHSAKLAGMIEVAHKLSLTMKNNLRNDEDRRVERVYVVIQCEGKDPHLHFHLKPRYEGDNEGDVFLIEKEFEEARWPKECEPTTEGEKIQIEKAEEKIAKVRRIVCVNKKRLEKNKFVRSKDERDNLICRMKNEIDSFIAKSR